MSRFLALLRFRVALCAIVCAISSSRSGSEAHRGPAAPRAPPPRCGSGRASLLEAHRGGGAPTSPEVPEECRSACSGGGRGGRDGDEGEQESRRIEGRDSLHETLRYVALWLRETLRNVTVRLCAAQRAALVPRPFVDLADAPTADAPPEQAKTPTNGEEVLSFSLDFLAEIWPRRNVVNVDPPRVVEPAPCVDHFDLHNGNMQDYQELRKPPNSFLRSQRSDSRLLDPQLQQKRFRNLMAALHAEDDGIHPALFWNWDNDRFITRRKVLFQMENCRLSPHDVGTKDTTDSTTSTQQRDHSLVLEISAETNASFTYKKLVCELVELNGRRVARGNATRDAALDFHIFLKRSRALHSDGDGPHCPAGGGSTKRKGALAPFFGRLEWITAGETVRVSVGSVLVLASNLVLDFFGVPYSSLQDAAKVP